MYISISPSKQRTKNDDFCSFLQRRHNKKDGSQKYEKSPLQKKHAFITVNGLTPSRRNENSLAGNKKALLSAVCAELLSTTKSESFWYKHDYHAQDINAKQHQRLKGLILGTGPNDAIPWPHSLPFIFHFIFLNVSAAFRGCTNLETVALVT